MGRIVEISNPPNPWATHDIEYIGEPPTQDVQVYLESAKSILSENKSPDVPFKWSCNPYRGCYHACAYCYARPTHQYLDFGAGTDFDRKIIVKQNAPELLKKKFESRSWSGEFLAFSGVTDCYQPLEASYEITRKCLEICRDYQNPTGIITKSALVRRDAELISEIPAGRVILSIPFADDEMARAIEPGTSSPTQRFKTLEYLAERGVPVGVGVSPIIPGLNDDQIVDILERARNAGATMAFRILLRLPNEVAPVFKQRLEATYPDRAKKVWNAIHEMRGGVAYRSGFGSRMKGAGPRWAAIESLFDMTCKRLNYETRDERDAEPPDTFSRPSERSQMAFDF